MRSIILGSCSALCITAAHASPLAVKSGIGLMPSMSNPAVITFDGPMPAWVSMSLDENASIASGSAVGGHAAPYLTGAQTSFGNGSEGPDTRDYLQVGTGSATLRFASPKTAFYFVCGSCDQQNEAAFSAFAGGDLIGSITGADISSSAYGSWGPDGTFGVNISSAIPFGSVTLSSPGLVTLEVAAVAVEGAVNVPEPASFAILLAGLLGIAAVARAPQPG